MAIFISLSLVVIQCLLRLSHLKKNSDVKNLSRYIYIILFFAIICFAAIIKSTVGSSTVTALVPFYKLFRLSEYGYMSIVDDLLIYLVPYLVAGLLIKNVFRGMSFQFAFIYGTITALIYDIPLFIINGKAFITDEYIYAGLGMMLGLCLYAYISYLVKNKSFSKHFFKYKRKQALTGLYIFIGFYMLVALLLIFDSKELSSSYGEIHFFKSSIPLPSNIEAEFIPDKESGEAQVYCPDLDMNDSRIITIAHALGIESDTVVKNEDNKSIVDNNSTLNISADGGWTYELINKNPIESDDSYSVDLNEYEIYIKNLFSNKGLGIELGNMDESTPIYNDETIIGYDLYYSTMIDSSPIRNSNGIVISIRGNKTITKIRKSDCYIKKLADVKIISQYEAYSKFISGNGAYTLFKGITSAKISSCTLCYMADASMGNYLPVWVFTCVGTDEEGNTVNFTGYVEAIG